MTAWDEMVDGRGGVRLPWRGLLGTLSGLERPELCVRAKRLERVAERAWRCDPIPLPLSAGEFATIEAGLRQRARLLEAVLADLLGEQQTLVDGVLPPALVYANPNFLRFGRAEDVGRPPLLHAYAADLVRGPDGQWRVLADRTRGGFGAGYAVLARRLLGQVMPEVFRGFGPVRALRPFFEAWQDALIGLAEPDGDRSPMVAMLAGGTEDAHWPEHAALAAELGCVLVQAGDLTVRGGKLWLRTLRGLRQVDVLFRRVSGAALDPVEQPGAAPSGVMGLLEAARRGSVRLLNHPGAAAIEVPALAAFMPSLCRRLLGETLQLATLPSLWLADEGAKRTVASGFRRWAVRPAFDWARAPLALAGLSREERIALEDAIEAEPWNWVGCSIVPPSVAPSHNGSGLAAEAVVLRLFLMQDETGWRMMPGGIARVLPAGAHAGEALPADGVFKDVWVMEDERPNIASPGPVRLQRISVRRFGDFTSRSAEDFYWFGRVVERLQGQARLARTALLRQSRGAALPREVAEVAVLRSCLVWTGLEEDAGEIELMVADALAPGGSFDFGLEQAESLVGALRDQLPPDVHGTFMNAVRVEVPESGRLDGLVQAMRSIQMLGTIVAGVVSDGVVQGDGRLFLELGRRIERAIMAAVVLATVLDQQAGGIEPALPMALELSESVLAYRNRYGGALQPAPVLDLLLADTGNPRSLAYQFAQASATLEAAGELKLAEVAEALRAEAEAAVEAGEIGPALLALASAATSLSGRIARRCFALPASMREVGYEIA